MNIEYLSKLSLKLKKLCTYYKDYTVLGFYDYKIIDDKIIIQYESEYKFKKIIVNGIDDISYNICKNRIKKNYYKYLFNMDHKAKYDKANNQLEKLAKIRDYKEEYCLK